MPTATPLAPPKIERSGNLTILTFTAHAIRDVESVIARELDALTDGTGYRHLLLDFTHVEFLNSMELSTLIILRKRVEAAGERLTLFNLRADVFRLFTITRLDGFARERVTEEATLYPLYGSWVHERSE